MEKPFDGKNTALTLVFGAVEISVEAENEQSMLSFLAAIKGREQELIAAFLASKAKEVPTGFDKFKDWLETDKASARIRNEDAGVAGLTEIQ